MTLTTVTPLSAPPRQVHNLRSSIGILSAKEIVPNASVSTPLACPEGPLPCCPCQSVQSPTTAINPSGRMESTCLARVGCAPIIHTEDGRRLHYQAARQILQLLACPTTIPAGLASELVLTMVVESVEAYVLFSEIASEPNVGKIRPLVDLLRSTAQKYRQIFLDGARNNSLLPAAEESMLAAVGPLAEEFLVLEDLENQILFSIDQDKPAPKQDQPPKQQPTTPAKESTRQDKGKDGQEGTKQTIDSTKEFFSKTIIPKLEKNLPEGLKESFEVVKKALNELVALIDAVVAGK